MPCSEIDLNFQHVRFIVIDEVCLVKCSEFKGLVTLVESIMYNHTPVLLDAVPCQAMPVLPTSYRASLDTTDVCCSNGTHNFQQLHKRKSEYGHQRAVAGRVLADMEKRIYRSESEELRLCMTLCENDVRPGTTFIRCSSGSSRPQNLQQLHKRKS